MKLSFSDQVCLSISTFRMLRLGFCALTLGSVTILSFGMAQFDLRISRGAERALECGCEVVEPTCEATECDAPCEPCQESCSSPSCESSDGCGACPRTPCHSRHLGIPGIGEGLLDRLDKMTDKFEQSVISLMGPCGRKKNSCGGCSSCSNACSSETDVMGSHRDSFYPEPMTSSPYSYNHPNSEIDLVQDVSSSPNRLPPQPISTNSNSTNSNSPTLMQSEPLESPFAPPPMPKMEALGDPFIDEARSIRRNNPEVHIAKLNSSVRGSIRRRYAPPTTNRAIEVVSPNPREVTSHDVITAGLVESLRQSNSVYSR